MGPSRICQLAESSFSVSINEHQLAKLSQYVDLLRAWSSRVRLISRNDRDRVWQQHILDCLSLVPSLPNAGRYLDLGSGAGLPGIVVSILHPELETVLFEPARMKNLFLVEAIRLLGLSNVSAVKCRAEDIATDPEYTSRFDCATARAVGSLPTLCDWIRPLLLPRGFLIALKGPDGLTEFTGGIPDDIEANVKHFTLPLTGRKRCLISLRFT